MMHPVAPFGQPWPAYQLEDVVFCPFCDSTDHAIAYTGVQDWSFQSAPGKWTYRHCATCEALFLSPRPTAAHIGAAYASYYTHNSTPSTGWLQSLKTRMRHELWAHYHQLPVLPRLHLPWVVGQALTKVFPQGQAASNPGFVLSQLAQLPKGKLLDVGCGNGRYLAYAQQIGWQAQGIEIDPAAVRAAQALGLQVAQAGYDDLPSFATDFACVVASHTLEHAHQPMRALRALLARLRPGGSLVLALPNAASPVRAAFGMYWRGLEAPRHIAIPGHVFLVQTLRNWGYQVQLQGSGLIYTEAESRSIQALAAPESPLPQTTQIRSGSAPDLIELRATKPG